MALVQNKKEFLDTLRRAQAEMERTFANRVQNTVRGLHYAVLSDTPVWSGSAVANYQWSVGAPNFTEIEPIDNGPPGPTNSMPLGVEPRRPPNEAIADASLESLSYRDPYKVFWLSNSDPDIEDLENGALPDPGRSRSPNGMIRLSLEFVYAKLEAGVI